MKLFLIALAATVFCTVVVSAAPPSPIYDDLALNIAEDFIEKDISSEIEKNKRKVQCIIKSVEDAIKGSKIVEVTSQWEVIQKSLEILFNRINACKNIEDKAEQTECIVNEFPNFQKVIDMFVVDILKKSYPDLYNRVQQNIKQNHCNQNID